MIVLKLFSPFPTLARWPLAYHFCLVERGELEYIPKMYLTGVGDSLNTTLHRHTYSHDIALVDQGGTRPTF